MAFVVADGQSAVGNGISHGEEIQASSVLGPGEGFSVGGKHFRIEGDPHALGGQGQGGLDIFQLQENVGADLGVLKELVRDGPNAVPLFQENERAVLEECEIGVFSQDA